MNIPNMLTIARMVLVMIFVVLAANAGKVFYPLDEFGVRQIPTPVFTIRLIAYILAIVAALTDLLDGYLARKWNQVTDFGALMDPLADKVFITATMLMAVDYRLMPAWIVVLVITREFMVTGLRTMAASRGIIMSADRWGKLKTFLQMLMLGLAGASWIGLFELHEAKLGGLRLWTIWMIFLCGIVIVTVLSGLAYFIRYRHAFLVDGKTAAEKA